MKFRIGILAMAALGATFAVSAVPAFAAPITVGTYNTGNCYPFSCGPTDSVTQYQESYTATAFPGSISFNTVTFRRDLPDSNANPMDSGKYAIAFYLAAPGWNHLSSNFAANEGTFLGKLGTFNISGTMPLALSLTGSTINYDPTQGDLLMNVDMTNGASFNGFYNDFFQADFSGTEMYRVYRGTVDSEGALVTTFSMGRLDVDGDRDIRATVPEPSSLAVLLAGLSAIAGALYFARKKAMA
ncbi:MAG TPA: PEP-CTERM sorting domain-containing protein [Rhizomicrobium sp.]|nr:PEP-CTERM sorting domain-containing protein [Rhizomicrobium sp.]